MEHPFEKYLIWGQNINKVKNFKTSNLFHTVTVSNPELEKKALAYQQMMAVLQEDALNQMRTINPDFDAFVKKTEQQAKDREAAAQVSASDGRTSTAATDAAVEKKEDDQTSTTTKTSAEEAVTPAVSKKDIFGCAEMNVSTPTIRLYGLTVLKKSSERLWLCRNVCL